MKPSITAMRNIVIWSDVLYEKLLTPVILSNLHPDLEDHRICCILAIQHRGDVVCKRGRASQSANTVEFFRENL